MSGPECRATERVNDGGRRLRGKEIGNRCADVMWSPERGGKVRADARISKQRQQESPHAQTIKGRGGDVARLSCK